MPDEVTRLADDLTAGVTAERPSAGNGSGPSAVERLEASRIDLVAMIERGLPPRQMVPGSIWWQAGKRHLVAAPSKNGKSLVGLVHGVDVIEAGGRVVIIDRENGAEEYARRLACILGDRNGATREGARPRTA
jgi:AAA domain